METRYISKNIPASTVCKNVYVRDAKITLKHKQEMTRIAISDFKDLLSIHAPTVQN